MLIVKQDNIEDAIPLVRRRNPHIRRLKKPKVWLYPHTPEKEYRKGMKQITDTYERITFDVLSPSNLQSLIFERNQNVPQTARVDAWDASADRLIESIIDRVKTALPDSEKEFLVRTTANQVNWFNEQQWRAVMRSTLGVEIFQREPWLNDTINSFIRENLTLISNMETDYISSIEGILQRGVRSGLDVGALTKNLQDKLGVTERRAQFIAIDQVGKLNGQLTMLRQTNLGIKRYRWKDSRDNKVRPHHREQHNRIYRWDNPPATGHPGEDYGCRCSAEPIFDDIIEELALV